MTIRNFKFWLTYTLREVHVDTVVIYQDALHLEVCLLAIFLILKFDERILKALTRPFVSNDLARYDSAEATEYCV